MSKKVKGTDDYFLNTEVFFLLMYCLAALTSEHYHQCRSPTSSMVQQYNYSSVL